MIINNYYSNLLQLEITEEEINKLIEKDDQLTSDNWDELFEQKLEELEADLITERVKNMQKINETYEINENFEIDINYKRDNITLIQKVGNNLNVIDLTMKELKELSSLLKNENE